MLSTKKEEAPQKKGKGYKDAQWEAEVRKSLANKKNASGAGTLSKQDQALVRAQLEKEATVRQRVGDIKARLEQGLHLVRSLVNSRVEQLKGCISELAALIREGAFGNSVTLVGETSFETYLVSSSTVMAPRRWCSYVGRCCPSAVPTDLIPTGNG